MLIFFCFFSGYLSLMLNKRQFGGTTPLGKKRKLPTKTQMVTLPQVAGPIVFFTTQSNAQRIKVEDLHRNWLPFGWSLVQHGMLMDSTTFDPNAKKQELKTFRNKDANLARFDVALSLSFRYTAKEYSFLCINNKYCDSVCIVDWGKVTKIVMEQVAMNTSIFTFDLLFLVALYASPLHVFIAEDCNMPNNFVYEKCWFLGSKDKCKEDLTLLIQNRQQCFEYFRFLGVDDICHMFDQDYFNSEKKIAYRQADEQGRFNMFVEFVQTKQWAAYWLFEHFPVTMFLV